MSNEPIVIVSAARTPIGGFQGALASLSAPELGSEVARAVLERAGMGSGDIDELLFGCVLPAGVKQAPARQVALGAGLDIATCCTTVNKMCGSGMKSVQLAHDQIKAGTSRVAIAGGMESMSQAPHLLSGLRKGMRMGDAGIVDHMFCDGLEDAYTGKLMGVFAQESADRFGISREQMDQYAIESLCRAELAIENGFFDNEIVPVNVVARKSTLSITKDEQPGNAKVEKILGLRPAFKADGTITAANSSSISDGAAALLMMSEADARQRGLVPLARILAHTSHAGQPADFPSAPVGAIHKLLEQTTWDVADVDLFEINEAFALVPLLAMQEFGIDRDCLNVHGGACALGHPVGASGARIIVTLLYALSRLSKSRGIAAICIGGGEAPAVAIEMIN